ncbi:aminomethyl-transferring glycine dehydrogenase subunit GcvPB [Candidatus Sumerlaeota bacterium]|nr:aminomethyl-transferring glycine dehydrogenase subunit GcvPB [Candidatus Sumerlaeota bacterium]
MELIFERSRPGRPGAAVAHNDVQMDVEVDPRYLRSSDADLPCVSEPEVVRHFTNLSKRNFGVDSHFYPLGSCTMKYNPKFTERIASDEHFAAIHPLQPQLPKGPMLVQGCLEVIVNLQEALCEIAGMDAFTTHPMAGAHGELTGIMMIAAYHRHKDRPKKTVIIPDSGHGTNPATAAIAGYDVVTVPSDRDGCMDFEKFKAALSDETAAVMLTCPNTLGVFEPRIREIADLTHEAGGLMYYDGANLNAILGKARPGDLGFDVVHINLHKTFATPHGGGGPGAGPVGVRKHLEPFLPISRIRKRQDGTFALDYDQPLSIGYVSPFYGNFAVLLKAYAYIRLMGREGLTAVAENAVLNAAYLRARLREHYDEACASDTLHEFVLSASRQAGRRVHAIDIAKGLIDHGMHPPTVYFPLNVKEAMMIEPTETETRETLDAFAEAMIALAKLAEEDPETFHDLPRTTPVGRLDEVRAARQMDVCAPSL